MTTADDSDDEAAMSADDSDVDSADYRSESSSRSDADDRAALAYLYRYEQMVRQQDAEDHATVSHLRPLFDRLRVLGAHDDGAWEPDPLSYEALEDGGVNGSGGGGASGAGRHCELPNLLSYAAMRRALIVLERGHDDDDHSEEVMSTDKQLMMVLSELTSQYDQHNNNNGHHHPPSPSRNNNNNSKDVNYVRKNTLSFPEFLHCYKTVVNGMMVLQMLPPVDYNTDTKSDKESSGIRYHRSRTRDRSMSMLRTFGPANEATTAATNNNNVNHASAASYSNKKHKRSRGSSVASTSSVHSASNRQTNTIEPEPEFNVSSNPRSNNVTVDNNNNSNSNNHNGSMISGSMTSDNDKELRNNKGPPKSDKLSLVKLRTAVRDTIQTMPKTKKRKMAFLAVFSTAFLTWYCGAFLVYYMKRSAGAGGGGGVYGSGQSDYEELRTAHLHALYTISKLERDRSDVGIELTKLRADVGERQQSKNDHLATATTSSSSSIIVQNKQPSDYMSMFQAVLQNKKRKEELKKQRKDEALTEDRLRVCEDRLNVLLQPIERFEVINDNEQGQRGGEKVAPSTGVAVNKKNNKQKRKNDKAKHEISVRLKQEKRIKRQKIKQHSIAVLSGAGYVLLAPKIWVVVGYLGSATKIVTLGDGVGKLGSIMASPMMKGVRTSIMGLKGSGAGKKLLDVGNVVRGLVLKG